MTGVLLLPLIAWAIEDKRTLEIRYVSLLVGYLAACVYVVLTPEIVTWNLVAAAVGYLIGRLGLPDGDALTFSYVGLVLGLLPMLLVLVVTFALLFMIPRKRAADMPAIPLIAAVSGVVACGMTYVTYYGRL